MKILVYGINYEPELTGIGKYSGEMSRWFADNNNEVAMSEITMVPDTMAELSGEDAEKVQKMLDALDDCDDVQDVYTNADLPEDDEE